MHGKSVVIPGRSNKVISMLSRLLPRSVMLSMVAATKRKHR